MPARYHDVITSRVRYYAHTLRSDYQAAALCLQEYEEGIKRLRTENINTNNYIRWCNIANIRYERISVNISSGDPLNFWEVKVNLNKETIRKIHKKFQ